MSRYYTNVKKPAEFIWKFPEALALDRYDLRTCPSYTTQEPVLLSDNCVLIPDTLVLLIRRSFLDA